jgi:hypothetical protein
MRRRLQRGVELYRDVSNQRLNTSHLLVSDRLQPFGVRGDIPLEEIQITFADELIGWSSAPARIRARPHFSAARPAQQIVDVAQRRVRRALGNGRPLAAGELAFEAIEQLVQQLHLSLVQGVVAQRCQNRALVSTASSVCCA